MKPGGVVLMIAGVWLLSQVLAGGMLERLNLVKA